VALHNLVWGLLGILNKIITLRKHNIFIANGRNVNFCIIFYISTFLGERGFSPTHPPPQCLHHLKVIYIAWTNKENKEVENNYRWSLSEPKLDQQELFTMLCGQRIGLYLALYILCIFLFILLFSLCPCRPTPVLV